MGNPRTCHVRLPVWRALSISGAALKGKHISIVATRGVVQAESTVMLLVHLISDACFPIHRESVSFKSSGFQGEGSEVMQNPRPAFGSHQLSVLTSEKWG